MAQDWAIMQLRRAHRRRRRAGYWIDRAGGALNAGIGAVHVRDCLARARLHTEWSESASEGVPSWHVEYFRERKGLA